jgi:orotate phosphoribosyltransferase
VTDDQLKAAILQLAYLEGEFVLRSGRTSSYYLDKYRFETQPEVLRELGKRLAGAAAHAEPEAERLAAPELGAVTLVAAAALESGQPFLLVRKQPKEYGTANRVEGIFQEGERVCVIEDIVTSGGAAVDTIQALREAGLECQHAVCVIDREEGGTDALARVGVRLEPLFRVSELIPA